MIIFECLTGQKDALLTWGHAAGLTMAPPVPRHASPLTDQTYWSVSATLTDWQPGHARALALFDELARRAGGTAALASRCEAVYISAQGSALFWPAAMGREA